MLGPVLGDASRDEFQEPPCGSEEPNPIMIGRGLARNSVPERGVSQGPVERRGAYDAAAPANTSSGTW